MGVDFFAYFEAHQLDIAGQLVVGGIPYGPDSFEQKLEFFPPRDSCQIPLLPEPRYGPSLSRLPGGKFVVCGGRIQGTVEGKPFFGRDFTDCVSWSAGQTTWNTAFTMRLVDPYNYLSYLHRGRHLHVAWTPSNLPNQIVLLGGRNDGQITTELSGEVIPGT